MGWSIVVPFQGHFFRWQVVRAIAVGMLNHSGVYVALEPGIGASTDCPSRNRGRALRRLPCPWPGLNLWQQKAWPGGRRQNFSLESGSGLLVPRSIRRPPELAVLHRQTRSRVRERAEGVAPLGRQ
jgi:hypothetical protein